MEKFRCVLLFLCGIVIGRLLGDFLISWSQPAKRVNRLIKGVPVYYKENHTEPGNTAEAERVARRTSVFCLIVTDQSHHQELESLDHAWIKRCNDRLLVSDVADQNVSTVGGGQAETSRLSTGLGHILDQKLDSFDWFLLATDKTYVIMENLRHFLDGLDPEVAAYYGERYGVAGGEIGLYLETGVILSRAALARLASVMGDDACWSSDRPAGIALEKCFAAVYVPFRSARDDEKKILFSYYEPLQYNWNGSVDAGQLSDRLAAFRLSDREPWVYEKFIYHITPIGTDGIVRNR